MLIKENWFGDNDNKDTDIVKDVESQHSIKSTFNRSNYKNCLKLDCFYASLMKTSDKRLNTKYLAQTLYLLENSKQLRDYGFEFVIYKDGNAKNADKATERYSYAEEDIDSYEEIANYLKDEMIEKSGSASIINVNIYYNLSPKATLGTFVMFFIKLFRRVSCFFSGYDPNSRYFSCPTSSCGGVSINTIPLFDDMRYQTLFYFTSGAPSKRFDDFLTLYKQSGGSHSLTEADIAFLSRETHWDKVTLRLLAYMYELIPQYLFKINTIEERNNIAINGDGKNMICIVKMSELYELLTPDPDSGFNDAWRISTGWNSLSLRVDEFHFRDDNVRCAKFYFCEDTEVNLLIDGITEDNFKWFIHTKMDKLDLKSIYINDISDIDIATEKEHTITPIDGDEDISSEVQVVGYPYLDDDNNQVQRYDIKTTKKKKHIQTIILKEHDNTKSKKTTSRATKSN